MGTLVFRANLLGIELEVLDLGRPILDPFPFLAIPLPFRRPTFLCIHDRPLVHYVEERITTVAPPEWGVPTVSGAEECPKIPANLVAAAAAAGSALARAGCTSMAVQRRSRSRSQGLGSADPLCPSTTRTRGRSPRLWAVMGAIGGQLWQRWQWRVAAVDVQMTSGTSLIRFSAPHSSSSSQFLEQPGGDFGAEEAGGKANSVFVGAVGIAFGVGHFGAVEEGGKKAFGVGEGECGCAGGSGGGGVCGRCCVEAGYRGS